jgi:hypothetical protein
MIKHMKLTSGVPLILVSVLLVFATASWSYAQTADTPKNMVIVGPRAATSTFVFATGIAEMINKYVGIKTVPEPGTMGRNVILVHKKEIVHPEF